MISRTTKQTQDQSSAATAKTSSKGAPAMIVRSILAASALALTVGFATVAATTPAEAGGGHSHFHKRHGYFHSPQFWFSYQHYNPYYVPYYVPYHYSYCSHC